MNKITKTVLSVILIFASYFATAQDLSSMWTKIDLNQKMQSQQLSRNVMPSNAQYFKLNESLLKQTLSTAPERDFRTTSNTIIALPTQNGKVENFRIYETATLSKGLQVKFPNIKSYVGQGIDDPSATARISVGNDGINVMVLSASHASTYVEPTIRDSSIYLNYSRNDIARNNSDFECSTEDDFILDNLTEADAANRNANDGMLRTYRLALACTGEYATFHLNRQGVPTTASDEDKKAAVLSAMNTSMARVNGVYERDVALTMVIVDTNDAIIFLNASTDPFTDNNPSALINQNQAVCDNGIGFANYDVGHVFSTGGGGIAQLRSPCTANKARGVTGTNFPTGDTFDIDYVAHEFGHQYGGNHTQNNNCQRSGASVEPGSASTIMGYAGICNPNVQNNSDDYFNAVNIQEMWNNISAGTGSNCPVLSSTDNLAPVADAGSDFTIPVSTPFILKGIGTDPNAADLLTYCWEQQDNTPAPMPPNPNSAFGPAFRSIDPLPSPDRYMPALATVVNGQTASIWEVVPAVARIMNFRLTVRDNVAGGGSTESDNVRITTDASSGPFLVTSQTSNVSWLKGSAQTITWDVANTDVAPVNSPNVDIKLSVDGGVTFDIIVLEDTPNDGTEDIIVPSASTTTQARIMVAGSDHIFYQLNTSNFTIEDDLAINDFEFDGFNLYPNPTNNNITILFKTLSQDNVNIKVYDIRGREVSNIDYKNPSSTFSQTLDYGNLNSGMYFVNITNGGKQATKKLIVN